jgi:predicted SAM-dependent methyltransferase
MEIQTKSRIRARLRIYGLEGVALAVLPAVKRGVWCMRTACGAERRMRQRYLAAAPSPKLHLGCGQHVLKGWLNADLYPLASGVLHVDASRRFPFCTATFDRIYSEHLIEHLTYMQGRGMLDECFRVLKPGGRIRISTPDLMFLTDLLSQERTELQERYVDWMSRQVEGDVAPNGVVVLNHFVRSWGHRFIYDAGVLSEALSCAGFSAIVRCEVGKSADPAFQGLENEVRMPEGFLALESMVFEAQRAR